MLRNLLHIPRKAGVKLQHGFTMVELIAVMVIAGVLAAVAVPKFISNSPFQARGFADQVQTSLRYAQKIAIAQHHNVCVTPNLISSPNTITLMISSTNTATCLTPLVPPIETISPSTSIMLSFTPLLSGPSFYFDPLGKPFDAVNNPSNQRTFTISGATNPVVVEAETGYVHSP